MATIVGNRAHETTTTTGTGTLNLAGAVAGRQTLVQAAIDASGDAAGPWEVEYLIEQGAAFEIGVGTLTNSSPDTLSRTTVTESSNSNAKVNWPSGTKNVKLAPSAQTLNPLYAATAAATAETLMLRDADGRAKAAAPAASDDVARKDEVDTVAGNLSAHVGTGGAAHALAVASGDAGFLSGADKAKLDDIEAGAEVNPSAADMLTELKTVDGSGSGLDADLGRGVALDFSRVHGVTGSQALPGGLIIKWGREAAGTSSRSVTFATPFPAACYNVQVTEHGSAGAQTNCRVDNVTTSGFDIPVIDTGNIAHWLAIGT